jgi:hypothetical protein
MSAKKLEECAGVEFCYKSYHEPKGVTQRILTCSDIH